MLAAVEWITKAAAAEKLHQPARCFLEAHPHGARLLCLTADLPTGVLEEFAPKTRTFLGVRRDNRHGAARAGWR